MRFSPPRRKKRWTLWCTPAVLAFSLISFCPLFGESSTSGLETYASDWDKIFTSGSPVAAFVKYEEIQDFFTTTLEHALCPAGFVARFEIGESYEKRPMYGWVLSSDAVAIAKSIRSEVEEAKTLPKGTAYPSAKSINKGEVLITAEHHAREPVSVSVAAFFAGRLCELYQRGDPFARSLLNRRRIVVVPFVNPDGYKYIEGLLEVNEISKAQEIRKNRRPTCRASPIKSGVDLNRNYDYKWKRQHDGCHSEEYEGAAPFSEPETQNIRGLVKSREFATALNFHTYGGFWTHPWNYAMPGEAQLPPKVQKIYAELKSVLHTMAYGSAGSIPALGYTTSGEADDWMFGECGVIAQSPEVGPESGDFFPKASLIPGTLHRNFRRIMSVALKAGVELSSGWKWHPLFRVFGSDPQLPKEVIEAARTADQAVKGMEIYSNLTDLYGTFPRVRVLTLQLSNSGLRDFEAEHFAIAVSGLVEPPGVVLGGGKRNPFGTFRARPGDAMRQQQLEQGKAGTPSIGLKTEEGEFFAKRTYSWAKDDLPFRRRATPVLSDSFHPDILHHHHHQRHQATSSIHLETHCVLYNDKTTDLFTNSRCKKSFDKKERTVQHLHHTLCLRPGSLGKNGAPLEGEWPFTERGLPYNNNNCLEEDNNPSNQLNHVKKDWSEERHRRNAAIDQESLLTSPSREDSTTTQASEQPQSTTPTTTNPASSTSPSPPPSESINGATQAEMTITAATNVLSTLVASSRNEKALGHVEVFLANGTQLDFRLLDTTDHSSVPPTGMLKLPSEELKSRSALTLHFVTGPRLGFNFPISDIQHPSALTSSPATQQRKTSSISEGDVLLKPTRIGMTVMEISDDVLNGNSNPEGVPANEGDTVSPQFGDAAGIPTPQWLTCHTQPPLALPRDTWRVLPLDVVDLENLFCRDAAKIWDAWEKSHSSSLSPFPSPSDAAAAAVAAGGGAAGLPRDKVDDHESTTTTSAPVPQKSPEGGDGRDGQTGAENSAIGIPSLAPRVITANIMLALELLIVLSSAIALCLWCRKTKGRISLTAFGGLCVQRALGGGLPCCRWSFGRTVPLPGRRGINHGTPSTAESSPIFGGRRVAPHQYGKLTAVHVIDMSDSSDEENSP